MTLSAYSADDSDCYDTVYIYIYIYCIYIYIYYNIYIYIYMYIPYIVPNTPYTHSLYQILATYLTDHYIVQVGKSKDHPLLPGVAFNTLRTFMRLCETYLKEKKEFSKDAELFFLCLDEHSKSKQRRWFEALQNTIIYSLCRVHMELGNSPLHTPL